MLINIERKKREMKNGFTLVEAVVGTAIFCIVFMGIFAAYRLGMKAAMLSSHKISAISIGNAQIERIRNLPYEEIGTKNASLPLAAGSLDRTFSQTTNGAEFNVLTEVIFFADSADGIGGEDSCDLDYKKADVAVSWSGAAPGQVFFSTKISPASKVQELQSCQNQPGGVLTVNVFDDGGNPVSSPDIKIYDLVAGGQIAFAAPAGGRHSFPLAPAAYRVEVSKIGYSFARTYGTDEVAVPDSLNPTVLKDNQTGISLSIDRSAAVSIDAIAPVGQDDFSDSFDDQSLVAEAQNVDVGAGKIKLAETYSSGFVVSVPIEPNDLAAWNELRFADIRPAGTEITYHILYHNGAEWTLIPDSDLGGNAAGLGISPVSLAGVDKGTYPRIKIKAMLSTLDAEVSPEIFNWQVFWNTSQGVPIASAKIHMRGSKTIGKNEAGEEVYKYDQDHILDGNGHIDIAEVDGDGYYFSPDPASGLALIGSDPPLQPIGAPSGGSAAAKLFLRAQNGLLITVQDGAALSPVFSAAVRVKSDFFGYEKTQHTDQNGQTYFTFLQDGTYDIFVSAPGYEEYAGTKSVAQESGQVISITQNE